MWLCLKMEDFTIKMSFSLQRKGGHHSKIGGILLLKQRHVSGAEELRDQWRYCGLCDTLCLTHTFFGSNW
jgi:hypothetical protein